jgi:hypothetical protein
MAGLVPATNVFLLGVYKSWMPGIKPGMTNWRLSVVAASSRRARLA